jgi:chromate transport protein ChrA
MGANIGGNYFVNFEFAGMRGYEATGLLGMMVGLSLGILLGVLLVVVLAGQMEKRKTN